MNVLKIHKLVDMMRFALTLRVVTNANVPLVTTVTPSMGYAHLLNAVVLLIKNVDRTKNASNLESAFVHHLSSLMPVMFVEVLARDSHVESMLNAVQLIHPNVCAKLGSKETPCKVV